MRISFDLDDTLICYQPGVPSESRLPWYLSLFAGNEPLRLGTRDLMRRLRSAGWEIWIYTTSHRSPLSVRLWLRCHGIIVGKVINQDLHQAHLQREAKHRIPSKNPAAFGIHLHVDDSIGVEMEGKQYGFPVVVISPEDIHWTDKVMKAALPPTRERF